MREAHARRHRRRERSLSSRPSRFTLQQAQDTARPDKPAAHLDSHRCARKGPRRHKAGPVAQPAAGFLLGTPPADLDVETELFRRCGEELSLAPLGLDEHSALREAGDAPDQPRKPAATPNVEHVP